MPEKLTLKLIARDQQYSDFDWMNIDRGKQITRNHIARELKSLW